MFGFRLQLALTVSLKGCIVYLLSDSEASNELIRPALNVGKPNNC